MLRLRDIMTTDLVTVAPELPLREAMELLTTKHLSGAPVMSGARVVGVISLTDFAAFASAQPGVPSYRPEQLAWEEAEEPAELEEGEEPPASYFSEMWSDVGTDVTERLAEPGGPEWNVLEEHTVEEAMNRALFALPPDTLVDRAADAMRAAGVHRVLVMEGDTLLGLVSTRDIADAVADHKLMARTYVFNRDREFDDRGWQ
jgi:CBS domain-containing protein